MTKKFFKWISLIFCSMIFSLSLVSCEEQNPDNPDDPQTDAVQFELSAGEGLMEKTGGAVEINYTGEPAITDVAGFPEWITDMNISVVGKVSVTVAANTDVPREAELIFTRGQEKVTFVLTQKGEKEAEPELSFSFNFVEIGDTYFKVDVTPDDMEMRYVVNVMDKPGFFKHYKEGKDKEFAAKELGWFEYLAGQNGMTLEEYMDQMLKKGVAQVQVGELMPNTEYVFFTYGVDTDDEFKCITNLKYEVVKTADIPQEEISFEIRIEDMQKGSFNTTVIPSRNDIYYYSNGYFKSDLEYYSSDPKVAIKQLLNQEIQDYIYYETVINGKTKEEALKKYRVQGRVTYPTKNINGGLEVVYYACAINDEGFVSSEITTHEFTTFVVEPSDNKFTCEISNITSNGFTADIKTTNSDQYITVCTAADTWAGYTDEEIVLALQSVDFFNPDDLTSGDQTVTFSQITPNTKCIFFIYGWDTMATTKLYKFEVTTKPE